MDSLQRGRIDISKPMDAASRLKAPYELIRCAIPRRTYFEPHYEWAAECIQRAIEWGDKLPAFKPIKDTRPPLEMSEIGLHTFFDDYEPVWPLP